MNPTLQRLLITFPLALSAALAQPPQDPPSLTFQAQTRLVLLSFHEKGYLLTRWREVGWHA